jgi:hypothetical protein
VEIAKFAHLRLGKILILIAQRLRHFHVFDLGRKPHGIENGSDQIVPCSGPAGSEVKDPVGVFIFKQPPHRLYTVFHIDEITHLPPVGILGKAGLE